MSICLGQLYPNPEQLLNTDTASNTIYHRNTGGCLKGPLEIVQPPAKAGSLRPNCIGLNHMGFEYLQRRRLHHLLGAWSSAQSPSEERFSEWTFYVSVCSKCPLFGSTLLTPTLKRQNRPSSLSLSHKRDVPVP